MSFDTKQQPSSNNLQSAICNLQSSELVSLDRHVRVPDVSIELWQAGQKPQVWLLDAKYRLDSGGGVPQQALDDAYTYLGSIGTADGQRAAQGALLLFPGSGNAERYPSGVGALPLLPGTTTALTEFLMVELGGASGN